MTENHDTAGDAAGDTTTAPPPADPTPEPRPSRRITDLTRSSDGDMVGGVAAGIARHFDVDPVIVRVAFVALSIVGLAGVILYVGLWFLLPHDDGRPSTAAEWFNLDRREPEVRTIGLIVTAVVAAGAVLGDTGWWAGGPLVWVVLVFLGLYWLVAVRPRRRSEAAGAVPGADPVDPARPLAARPPKAPRQPPLLFWLTACAAAVVLGGLWLYGEVAEVEVGHRTYLATALLVVGLGATVGAFWGRSAGLIAVGIVLVPVLSLSGALPSGAIGEQRHRPATAVELEASYDHGIGRFELNLDDLDDADDVTALAGRTIEVEAGIGETVVIVPDGLPVTVRADLSAGQIDVFEESREIRGTRDGDEGADLVVTSEDPDALIIDIDQTFGHIKVVHS